MNQKKGGMSISKKMLIALVGGLVVGVIFMMIHQSLIKGGNEATWITINKLLFQDITVPEGVGAIGLFYIIGQIFMKGLQAAVVPLVLVSLSLALCSISNSTKLGRIAGKSLAGFFGFYVCGAA
jgi:Na+/H+-dicarboxylate symporter